MRLVVLGGGGFRVPLLHHAIGRRPELNIAELVLHDVDPGRLAVILAALPTQRGLRVTTTSSLSAALRGADAVFSAVRVGGTAARVADERDALSMGLLGQETVGAGGLAYGLRSLPFVLHAARMQAELAPGAWLLMFTNPAGMATQAAAEVLRDRVVGICDSPSGLIDRAIRALGFVGEPGAAPATEPADAGQDADIAQPRTTSGVEASYLGINHLGWLTALRAGGVDQLPALLADPSRLERFEEGRLFGPDLLSALGCLPNEYLAFYYRSRELAAELATGRTRGEVLDRDQTAFYTAAAADLTAAQGLWRSARLRREETYLAETRTQGQERDQQDLTGGGYQDVALDALAALTGGPPARVILNARNGSATPQLPPEMIVETWCRVDRGGTTALPAPSLDLHQLGLICSVRAAETALIEAVRSGRREDAVRAFAIHPLVGSWDLGSSLADRALARAAAFSPTA